MFKKWFSRFGADRELDKAAENLVMRARAGDQNAMATIALVRKNKNKNIQAQKMFPRLMAYVKSHPVTRSVFGNEVLAKEDLQTILKSNDPVVVIQCIIRACKCGVSGAHAAIVALANGPALNALRVTELASAMHGELQESAFRFGVDYHRAPQRSAPSTFQGHMGLGQVVGRARGIQVVRRGGPVSTLSHPAAIELGDKRSPPRLISPPGAPHWTPTTGAGKITADGLMGPDQGVPWTMPVEQPNLPGHYDPNASPSAPVTSSSASSGGSSGSGGSGGGSDGSGNGSSDGSSDSGQSDGGSSNDDGGGNNDGGSSYDDGEQPDDGSGGPSQETVDALLYDE
jgi:hypothetical protein